MAVNMKKVSPDCGHDTEYLDAFRNGDGRFGGTGVDVGVHDTAAKTLMCENEGFDAVTYFHRWRRARV